MTIGPEGAEANVSAAGSGVQPWVSWTLFFVVLAIALFPRTLFLTSEVPWYDEIITVEHFENSATLDEFLEAVAERNGPVPPGYFVLQYGWAQVFGPSVVSMRALSITAWLGGCLCLAALAWRYIGWTGAVLAVFVVGLNPHHVYYSQEIRMYAPVFFLAALSSYAFVSMLTRNSWAFGILHVAINILIPWFHSIGAFLFVPQGLVLLIFWRDRIRILGAWFVTHIISLYVFVTWVDDRGMEVTKKGLEWVLPASILATPETHSMENLYKAWVGVYDYLPGHAAAESIEPYRGILENVLLCLLVLSVVRVLWSIFRPGRLMEALSARVDDKERSIRILLTYSLLWLVVPPLLLYLLSQFWRPSFVYRYVFYASAPAYLLIGAAVVSVRHRGVRLAALTSVIGIVCIGAAAFLPVNAIRFDWQGVVDEISDGAGREEAVLVPSWNAAYELQYQLDDSSRDVWQTSDLETLIRMATWVPTREPGVWAVVPQWMDKPEFEDTLRKRGFKFESQPFTKGRMPSRLYYITEAHREHGADPAEIE